MSPPEENKDAAAPTTTTVAVIGCGPGGMFFCHAMETYRRELERKKDKEALKRLPHVTCFERASGPGGVWRAKRSFGTTATDENNDPTSTAVVLPPDEKKDDDGKNKAATTFVKDETTTTTNMYEALWTNGAKEGIECFDYTFREHFGAEGRLPVYLPRQALLEYMVARVTKNCPDFFERYVKFDTSVTSVRYDASAHKFEVTTQQHRAHDETTTVGYYDKCIWAAGNNGKKNMPASLCSMLFRQGGFQGRVIHSSDTADFEEDVRGKRILLLGGSYSAEDLALMAIKVGAERVYISSRQDENVVSWTGAWPRGKVKVLYKSIPVAVTPDGRGIRFAQSDWEFPNTYFAVQDEDTETVVNDIDTVIFCTGYAPSLDMLDPELRAVFDRPYENKLKVPADWKMEHNDYSETLGDVEPDEEGVYWRNSLVKFPDIYRGMFLISNPSMIFLEGDDFANPLFGIEGNAWLLMRYLTGTRPVPSKEEMRRQNQEDALRQMQNPYLRYYMDRNYYNAVGSPIRSDLSEDSWYKFEKEYYRTFYRIMARTLREANYPGIDYGTYDELSDAAKTVYRYGDLSYYHRYNLDPNNSEENEWRTFRDYTDGDKFQSLFTGARSVPLKMRWLDIDPHDEDILKYDNVDESS